MPLQIDNVEELRELVKTTGLQVKSVEELQELLHSVNAHYNPEADRMRVAKLLATVPISVTAGVAGVASFFLAPAVAGPKEANSWIVVPALAIIWGAVALVGCVSAIAGALILRHRAAPSAPPQPAPLAEQAPALKSRLTGFTTPDQL